MSRNLRVAIVGATGAVGIELLRLIEKRDFPVGQLKLLASAKSAGKTLRFRDRELGLETLTPEAFTGVDLALFSAGAEASRTYAPLAAAAGAVVIDNSSAFRMDPEVPLVVPEINGDDARGHRGIIANPNCTTIISLMALSPLHRAFGLRRVIAASYQAVSGAGAKGILELQSQVSREGGGTPAVFPHPIAFNVIPHVDAFQPDGYTKEEHKFVNESRKILHLPSLRASITCVRVPVYRSHAIALHAEFERPVSVDRARDVLAKAPGLELNDDPARARYPVPLGTSGQDACQVGRVRLDSALDNALAFWVCGDQLLKGAALNAIQIAELLVPATAFRS
ncbi:MAG TPA: aspartate-semialdehyde dehydrogenase [Chthoniobacterales bacterium]